MFLPWMVALHAFRRLPCLLAKCHLNEDAPDFEMVAYETAQGRRRVSAILKGCEGDSDLLFNDQRKQRLCPPLSRLEPQHALLHQFQSLTTPHSPINRWTPSASSSATPAKSTYPPFLRLLFPTTQHALLSAALSMESGSSRRDVEILMC